MRQTISQLTQSRFYSPAFNAAIFDGALRIYFAQYQEPLALKVYFRLQERLRRFAPESASGRTRGPNLFIMLYPTDEIFQNSFGSSELVDGKVVMERLGEDFVLGVRGPLNELDFEQIYDQMDRLFTSWANVSVTAPAPALEA